MSSNQKKIRDLERMMKKFGNTPDLVAKLEAAKQSKGEVQVKEKMRKNSTKYHMVKFLERKKMTRSIRSVESKIKKEEDSAELAVLNKKRDKLMDDLAYIMYYPMEHKYIALFPSKNGDADSDGEDVDVEKSKVISQKARALALQRWSEDQGFGGDKVAYAMEVEYKGGAAAAESGPGKAIQANKEQQKAQQSEKASLKSVEKKLSADKSNKKDTVPAKASTAKKVEASDSSSDSDSSDSSSSDSDSDSSTSSKEKSVPTTTKSTKAGAKPTTTAKEPVKVEPESSDNDNDDFFVEEANLSESELNKTDAAPKVYQDGNTFRYKEERKNVHEIRFAATKRKYERHKRVFNNSNKRGDSDRSKKSRN